MHSFPDWLIIKNTHVSRQLILHLYQNINLTLFNLEQNQVPKLSIQLISALQDFFLH